MVDPAHRLHRAASPLSVPVVMPASARLIDRWCADANLSLPARQAVAAAPLGGAVFAVVAIIAEAPIVASVLLLGTWGLPAIILVRRRHRRRDAVAEAVPFVLDRLARAMRGGASLSVAVRQSVATTPEPLFGGLEALVDSLDLGQPIERAWQVLATREASDELHGVAALVALLSVGEAGGATALDNAARSLRAQSALRRETKALVAQAELSMHVLAALPAGFVVLGLAFGNDTSASLFTTTFGRMCLVIGGSLELVGLAWMKALLRRVMA